MIRAACLLFGLSAVVVALLAANFHWELSFVETLLGILAIISFAVVATAWTINHDV